MFCSFALTYVVFRHGAHTVTVAASAVLDVLTCALCLLAGVLHPWEAYTGLLRLPDTAVVPLLSAAAGLRFSWVAFGAGASVNACCFMTLASLDQHLNAPRVTYDSGHVYLYCLYLAVGTIVGGILAGRGTQLANAAAIAAAKADAARGGLMRVLSHSHDVRSLISAVSIQATLASRQATTTGLTERVELLQAAIEHLKSMLETSRDQAYGALVEAEAPSLAPLLSAASHTTARLKLRFPGVDFRVHGKAAVSVWMCGGSVGLERLLSNLLLNAVEGDGERGSSRVSLTWDTDGREVRVTIEDDGPGFDLRFLGESINYQGTTKPEGWGIGLLTCQETVRASGGSLELSNRTVGGACVRVTLRARP
jgi:signal transduction histidine kinase